MKKISTRFKKLLPSNRFARSVSVLAGGTAAGQLIVVTASPVLTRLYTPEDFGLLAVYAGILGILGVIASLRYQLAIPLPESDKKAAEVAVLSLLVVFVTTVLISITVALLGPEITNALNTPALGPYLWLVPLGLFLMGGYQVFQYWAIRTKSFASIAKTRLSQSLGMVAVQVTGYTFGPIALLLGRIVGQSAGIYGLIRSALQRNSQEFASTSLVELKQAAVEYRHFPVVSTWTGLASSGGSNLPPILIAACLGVGPAGLFALTYRVLSQPMAVIGKAVGDVFYREAAQAHREGRLRDTVEGVFSSLVLLALPPAVTLFLITPEAFTIVFGSSWQEAGKVAQYMTPWLFLQFVVTPSTRVYPIIGVHGVALRFQLSFLLSSILSILVGALYFESLIISVILLSSVNCLIYLWRIVYTYSLVGGKWRVPLCLLVKALPWGALCNAPILLLLAIKGEVFNADFSSVALMTISFLSLILVTRRNLRNLKR